MGDNLYNKEIIKTPNQFRKKTCVQHINTHKIQRDFLRNQIRIKTAQF